MYAVDLHLGTDPVATGWNDDLGYCTGVTTAPLADEDFYFTNVFGRIKSDGFVEFLKDNTDNVLKRYYPITETKKLDGGKVMSTGMNLSFLAYTCPANVFKRGSAYEPVIDGGRLLKKFEMYPSNDTNVDVLWARVDAEPGLIPDENEVAADGEANNGFLRGFNARYQRYLARQNNNILADEDVPELKFRHAASMIHIFIKAAEDADEQAFIDSQLKVTKMNVAPKYTHLALDLLSGELIPDPSYPAIDETLYAYIKEGWETYSVSPSKASAKEYHDGFFVMPGARIEDEKITIQFQISMTGDTSNKPAPKTVDLPLPTYTDPITRNEVTGYQAGVEYNYYISVESPEQIVIKTSLTPWDEESGAAQLGDQEIPFE